MTKDFTMAKELWQEQAHKLGGPDLVQVITDIRDGQQRLIEQVEEMDTLHKQSRKAIDDIKTAFPLVGVSPDYDGHRRYHQTMIEVLAERRRLRVAVIEKSVIACVYGLMVLVLLCIFRGLHDGFHDWVGWFTK